jgi:4-diphosphocytidyl-2C-methyl-D-erythritol kinase
MKDCKVYAKVNLSSSIIAHNSQIDGGHDINTKSQLLLGERTHLKL